MSDAIIHRLLHACTRGTQQKNLVNEVIESDMVIYSTVVNLWPLAYGSSTHYGETKLQHKSWKNLKSRLIDAGFTVKHGEWVGNRRKIVIGLGLNK